MIITQESNFISYINPDTHALSTQIKFSIFEHAYFEFQDQVISIHHQNRFDNSNLLYYMIEGSGITYFENKEIPIEPGKIYFYPCTKKETYRSIFQAGTKKLHIRFHCNLFGEKDVFSELTEPQPLEDFYHLTPMLKEAILSADAGKQVILPSLVQMSIAPIFSQVQHTLKEQLTQGKKYEILFDYIDKNLYVDLTTEKISKETGFSVYTLTHTIPNEMGFTFKKYITKKILQMVCFDLIYSESLIRNIAYKYHFSTEGYFSDWFFKMTNYRPKDYRRKFRQENNYSFYRNYLDKE